MNFRVLNLYTLYLQDSSSAAIVVGVVFQTPSKPQFDKNVRKKLNLRMFLKKLNYYYKVTYFSPLL